jgi:alpha-L-fucosidase 2
MGRIFLACAVLLASASIAFARAPRPLRLAAPIQTWDEAIPLGNGLTGGLLWGDGETINLSLDRGDLWDLRQPAIQRGPDWNYATLQRLVRAGDQATIEKMFDRAYDDDPYPTKIPCGRLVLKLSGAGAAKAFVLDLQHAQGEVQFDQTKLTAFFSATQPIALLHITGALPEFEIQRPASLDKLGYAAAQTGGDTTTKWIVQEAALGLRYAVVAGVRRDDAGSTLALAITSTRDGKDPLALARQRVRDALGHGYAAEFAPHEKWWHDFWATSDISIPDASLQVHYDRVKYFYGAASRTGAPPIPLQGVWTSDSNELPPWKGDYHNDLNTQMTYLAYPTAGLFESGASFIDFNWNLLPAYREYARKFFGARGAAVPGVMTLAGKPMGGWAQYSLSPVAGLWVGQSFYLHWRYTMDRQFLATRAYPWLEEVARSVVQLMHEDGSGHLKLPLSASPEIFDNSLKAWLPPNSNYDEALLQWSFAALAEMAETLGKRDEATRWRALQRKLAPLDIDPDTHALTIAHGIPYSESHRHFAQAMAIYPLGALSPEDGPEARATIRATLDQLDRIGTKEWCGYSYAWMAAMSARAGEAERALRYLRDYERGFILRNGFHANGDQSGNGLSGYTYRPFTLEGNFLAMQAVHEMLLQSDHGIVRIFPAVSASWREASFSDLRAEGGYKIGAQRRGGRTTAVRIEASSDGVLRLRNDFPPTLQWNRVVEHRDDTITVRLKAGESLLGRDEGN